MAECSSTLTHADMRATLSVVAEFVKGGAFMNSAR